MNQQDRCESGACFTVNELGEGLVEVASSHPAYGGGAVDTAEAFAKFRDAVKAGIYDRIGGTPRVPIAAVQWNGAQDTAALLTLTGHQHVVINSFGQPVINHRDGSHTVVDFGDWAFLHHGEPFACTGQVWSVISEHLLARATLEVALKHSSDLNTVLIQQRDAKQEADQNFAYVMERQIDRAAGQQ